MLFSKCIANVVAATVAAVMLYGFNTATAAPAQHSNAAAIVEASAWGGSSLPFAIPPSTPARRQTADAGGARFVTAAKPQQTKRRNAPKRRPVISAQAVDSKHFPESQLFVSTGWGPLGK